MHPIVAKIDDLDAEIGACAGPRFAGLRVGYHREHLRRIREAIAADLGVPAPGSAEVVAGATITHRPDLAYDERARQAAAQGDAERGIYKPLREALEKDAAGGSVQQPAADRPAELAKIGSEVR